MPEPAVTRPAFRYRGEVMRRAGVVLVLAVSACRGPGNRPAPTMPPPAPAAVVAEIHPGVLRGLLIAGELHVRPDDATRAAMSHAGEREIHAKVAVCLDPDGRATTAMLTPSGRQHFDEAVLTAVAAWRFRPYRRDGRPVAVCSSARFRHHLDQPAIDAVPAGMTELPAGVIDVAGFPLDEVNVPPAPGVALVRVCRHLGSRAAPRLTFMQSSGDATTDRAALEQREAVPSDERPGPRVCRIRSRIVPSPVPVAAASPGTADAGSTLPPFRPESGSFQAADKVLDALRRSGVQRLRIAFEVCIDRTGRVDHILLRGSSGSPALDADITNTVAGWRYRPMLRDGVPVRACTISQIAHTARWTWPRRY